MTIDLYIDLWISEVVFQINSSYEESNDKPMFAWYITFGARYYFGILVQKIYDQDYRWQRSEVYNPYFKKWQTALMFLKFKKIFNKQGEE